MRALKLPNQVPRPPADDWFVSVRLGVNAEDLHSATGPVDRPHGMADKQQIAAYERALAPLIKKAARLTPRRRRSFCVGCRPGVVSPSGIDSSERPDVSRMHS